MIAAPIPANEEKRLQELYSLELLDTPYEEEFDEIVRIASKICNAPMSVVTLLDSQRQWFKAKVGNLGSETKRDVSFCGHAIMGDGIMEIPNALDDERFVDNPLVTNNPNIRFYAGMPLVTQRGYKIGTLCVIDTVPRNLDEDQLESLETLARQVMRIIELRVKVRELNELTNVKNKIISIIGHDVRNPLASVKNILQMKEMGFIKGDDEDRFLKMAQEQVDNTISMVGNLAEWGKLNLTTSNTEIKPLPLHDITEACIKGLTLNINDKNNVVKNETSKSIFTKIDENSLSFILRNLITNANKFTDGGTITIKNNRQTISVCDTGVGMTKEQIEALRTQGQVSSTAGTSNEGGTGLGLMLIKDFLRKIKSEMFIDSVVDKGTCIHIKL